MTPEDYGDKYLKLTWQYGKNNFQVSIHKYLAMDSKICSQRQIDGSTKAKNWLLTTIKKDQDVMVAGNIIQIKSLNKSMTIDGIEKTFHGKASPSQIADTLLLATHLKFITATLADPTVTGREAARPQEFADWYLGMDCSGFANNFLGFNTNQYTIESLDRNKMTRRVTIDSIVAGDVMVTRDIAHNDYKHIAIVARVAKKSETSLQLFTVESYGYEMKGVGRHDRNLIMSSPGVFVDPDPTRRGWEIYIQVPPARCTPSL